MIYVLISIDSKDVICLLNVKTETTYMRWDSKVIVILHGNASKLWVMVEDAFIQGVQDKKEGSLANGNSNGIG